MKLGISLQGKKTSSRLLSRKSVLVSNGNRDLGVTFKVHPRSQASSPVEVKNSALLSSCDGYLLEPIEWPKGVKPPLEFSERTRDCPLGPAGKEGPHLVMTGESRGFIPAAVQRMEFFWSYDGELREPFMRPREVQSPFKLCGAERHCSRLTAAESVLKTW